MAVVKISLAHTSGLSARQPVTTGQREKEEENQEENGKWTEKQRENVVRGESEYAEGIRRRRIFKVRVKGKKG